jgi:glycosyltransferase involved in cell wall biosynthesis
MLVSIIIPNYNGAKYLPYCIQSVLNQTYSNWELIIVDDCSTDNSVSIVDQYIKKDSRIQLLKNGTNSGVMKTRNKAVEIAKGDIFAFLDSDDIWHENKLQEQIAIYKMNPNIVLVFSNYEYINIYGDALNKIIKAPIRVTYQMLLKTNYIGCSTATYNAKVLGKRYFYGDVEDYVLWLSILKEKYNAINVNKCLVQYRISQKGSVSYNKFKRAIMQWDTYRDIEKLSVSKSIYYTIFYIYYALKKHFL